MFSLAQQLLYLSISRLCISRLFGALVREYCFSCFYGERQNYFVARFDQHFNEKTMGVSNTNFVFISLLTYLHYTSISIF